MNFSHACQRKKQTQTETWLISYASDDEVPRKKTFDSPTFYLCTTSLLMLTSRLHMIHITTKSFEASIHLGIECSDMKHDIVTHET